MKPNPVADQARAILAEREAAADDSAGVFLSVLVESAYLLAAADGVVSPPERQTLAETIGDVLGGDLPQGELVAMINSFADALDRDGVDQRMVSLAHALQGAGARRAALSFAALIALCDRELVAEERESLGRLGASFGFDGAAVQELLNEVADGL